MYLSFPFLQEVPNNLEFAEDPRTNRFQIVQDRICRRQFGALLVFTHPSTCMFNYGKCIFMIRLAMPSRTNIYQYEYISQFVCGLVQPDENVAKEEYTAQTTVVGRVRAQFVVLHVITVWEPEILLVKGFRLFTALLTS